jgi:K+-sensing histidine kinase KdpD
MTSFVETESERRFQDRSKNVLPADLMTESGPQTIYVMELRPDGCRAVVSSGQIPTRVKLRLALPDREAIHVLAQAGWSKELAPNKWHVNFDHFEFASPAQEQSLVSYLNEVTVQTEELGVKALRSLGSDELRRLSRLVKASRTLNPCQGYVEAVEQVVDVTRRALGAERGLFLVERGEDEIVVEVARGAEAIKARGLRFSTTVARNVAESRKPLLSLDAQTDQALGAVQSIQMLGTVSVMCVPLATKSRRFGFIYVDNSMSKGLFRESDLALATIIADLAAASLEKNWHHLFALQGERVSSTKNLISHLSRDLLPALTALDQFSERVTASDETQGQLELLKGKSKLCLEFMERVLPLGAMSRRNSAKVDLMDVFEEIALDFDENVEFPLPPPSGWPKLSVNLNYLTEIVIGLIEAAKAGSGTIRVRVLTQGEILRITVCNVSLKLTGRELRRVFHPFVERGLSDTQRLVHEHRGLIRAHLAPEGGTVFTAELPL